MLSVIGGHTMLENAACKVRCVPIGVTTVTDSGGDNTMSVNEGNTGPDDDGVGKDGTIPDTDDGVAVGHTEESSFEPEEDEQAP